MTVENKDLQQVRHCHYILIHGIRVKGVVLTQDSEMPGRRSQNRIDRRMDQCRIDNFILPNTFQSSPTISSGRFFTSNEQFLQIPEFHINARRRDHADGPGKSE